MSNFFVNLSHKLKDLHTILLRLKQRELVVSDMLKVCADKWEDAVGDRLNLFFYIVVVMQRR